MTWSRPAGWLADAGLALVLFVAPLWMGGRQETGRLAYVIAAGLAAAGWFFLQGARAGGRFRRSGAEWLIAAGGLWLLVQLAPLPGDWARRLSPLIEQRLPLWRGEAAVALGDWRSLSLAPEETRTCLVLFFAHALVFLAALQRMDSVQDVRRWLRGVAFAASGCALLGLIQYGLGWDRFLGVYDHPFRSAADAAKGPFANQNHFAHFLALGLGPLLLGWTGRRDAGSWLAPAATWIGLAFTATAGVLSFSRGGWIALSVAVLCSGALYAAARRLSWRAAAGLAAAALVVFLLAASQRGEALLQRWASLEQAQTLSELSARREALWTAHRATLGEVWLTGAGAGAHRYLYPIFMENPFGVDFSHAESGYLQVLLETGVVGLTLLLLGWAWIARWAVLAWRGGDAEIQGLLAAAVGGLSASLVHSLADFVWYIPACMSLTLVLAAATCRLSQLAAGSAAERTPRRDSQPLSRWTWASVGIALAGMLLAAVQHCWAPARAQAAWDNYFRINRGLALSEEAADEELDAMIRSLTDCLDRHPHHARARLRLSYLLLRRFERVQAASENPMPLAQIREAAIASQFPDRDSLRRWLDAALGSNLHRLTDARRHAKAAVALCPLQGEAYIYLADLLFLDNLGEQAEALVGQALLTRPHDGPVLLAAGSQLAYRGEEEAALVLWRRAFQLDAGIRRRLLAILAPQAPAELLIEQFQPDLDGMEKLYWQYASLNDEEQTRVAGEHYAARLAEAAAAARGSQAADLLVRLSQMLARQGELELAIDACRQAIAQDPSSYAAHRHAARWYSEAGRWPEAAREFRWCLRRQPADPGLTEQLQVALSRSHSGEVR